MDKKIKIHIFEVGKVCVSPALPFGGQNCSLIKASGIFTRKSKRMWLPVSSYLIEHPKGKILVDCGWDRSISPCRIYDRHAQIKSLGSPILYFVNQGVVDKTIDEYLKDMNIKTSDLDYVLLTHLDCDHANGLNQVKDAKRIMTAKDEMNFALKHSFVRYQKKWWKDINIHLFDWKDQAGPFLKSYDLFNDHSIELINIPGHSDGLFAVKITNDEGKYVLLYSDGGYARKSWEKLIPSGVAANRKDQMKSLKWIKEMSENDLCVASLANHEKTNQKIIVI